MTQPVALTLAGADPTGGAGIQADLKTFAAHRVYGTSVITALTAQNAHRFAIYRVAGEVIRAQAEAVFEEHAIKAIKIGLLADREGVGAVIDVLQRHNAARAIPVVLDPILRSSNDRTALDAAGVALMREALIPLVDLIKPNLEEAASLLGIPPATDTADMQTQAQALRALGCGSVYLSGGHLAAPEATDVYCDAHGCRILAAPRVSSEDVHGSGCTLSAAIAAHCALGADIATAVRRAKDYLQHLYARDKQRNLSGVPISFDHLANGDEE